MFEKAVAKKKRGAPYCLQDFPEDTLNINYHVEKLVIKALNKTTPPRAQRQASILLGCTERTVFTYIEQFDLHFFRGAWVSLKKF
jgi:hypothetical protein